MILSFIYNINLIKRCFNSITKAHLPSQEHGSSTLKNYPKIFQPPNVQHKHQPRSLNTHSTSLHGLMHERAANSLLMTTTSKYTLNQHSDSPKSMSENPSNTTSNSQAPLSIFRGGRSSSISTDSPQATSSSGGDMSPQNDYFKKQIISNHNGPESLNWASANAISFNGETILKKSKIRGSGGKSNKENSKASGKTNGSGGNGSECGTSSTECGSDYSDQNSTADDKPIVYNVSTSRIVVPNCKNKNPNVIANGISRANTSAGNPKINIVTPTPAPRTSVQINTVEYKFTRNKDSKLSAVKEATDEEASWSYQERKKRQESLV